MFSVVCKDLFQKSHFVTYSEFYLAMAIAAECGRREGYLDMSGMRINSKILSKSLISYYKYLRQEGYIKTEDYKKEITPIDPETLAQYINPTYITENESVLVQERDDCYFWNYDWCKENYLTHLTYFTNMSNLEKICMHITAYMVVKMYIGEAVKKPLILEFREHIAKSIYNYINIYSCIKTLPWLAEMVEIDTDISSTRTDLDYFVFWNEGNISGKAKYWSIPEKKELMEDLGIGVESVVILWTRKGMCNSNPGGRIESALVGIIKEIGKDFIEMDAIALNKTKEEVDLDYYSIPEDIRHLYTDLLHFKPATFSKSIQLPSLGIENYLYDESQFITKISPIEKVNKTITVDRKRIQKEMTNVDAIYWLLCQYEIDFDRELYKHMYNNDKDLLWDLYEDEEEPEV